LQNRFVTIRKYNCIEVPLPLSLQHPDLQGPITSFLGERRYVPSSNRFKAVKSHDYYGESGRRKNAVLPGRTTQMDGKTFPPAAQGILMKPRESKRGSRKICKTAYRGYFVCD